METEWTLLSNGWFTKVTLPIPISIFGRLNKRDEVIMGIHTVLFMRMEELANNQNSNNWWHHPGKLSFEDGEILVRLQIVRLLNSLFFRD